MGDRDKINVRIVLRDHEDNEAQWAIHYKNDGLDLVRPAARIYIPYEMCEPIARALTKRPPHAEVASPPEPAEKVLLG